MSLQGAKIWGFFFKASSKHWIILRVNQKQSLPLLILLIAKVVSTERVAGLIRSKLCA